VGGGDRVPGNQSTWSLIFEREHFQEAFVNWLQALFLICSLVIAFFSFFFYSYNNYFNSIIIVFFFDWSNLIYSLLFFLGGDRVPGNQSGWSLLFEREHF
jgi:hypothetical protein